MGLSVRHAIFQDGERYMLLVGENGMPLYFPTLYVTVVARGGSKAANTIRNTLCAIKVLYDWQADYKVDIESS